MHIQQTQNFTFDTQQTIVSASLISADECVVLLSSGQVLLYNGTSVARVFNVFYQGFGGDDGGFDIGARSSIYTLDNIVVLVNDYARHGYVHYPGKYDTLHLSRGAYHVEFTRYPITLYKNGQGIPHLIYGQDWNHLQIMNLDTRQVLTAAKSLIEENAEENHIEFYKQHAEEFKQAWPAPYDYSYGALLMSPDAKNFLSKGWVWGSSDCYNIYNVADFTNNSRVKSKNVGYWEHEDRPACWIDKDTVTVVYNPHVDDEENRSQDDPIELHVYDISVKKPIVIKRIVLTGERVMPKDIFYCDKLSALVAIYRETGIGVFNIDGEVLLKDTTFKPVNFYPELQLFLSFSEQTVSVHQLRNV